MKYEPLVRQKHIKGKKVSYQNSAAKYNFLSTIFTYISLLWRGGVKLFLIKTNRKVSNDKIFFFLRDSTKKTRDNIQSLSLSLLELKRQ
jgi:hypothetical protein